MEEESSTRSQIIKIILEYSEAWPDIVALWSGMVKQLREDGWSEPAARALVLSTVTQDNGIILAVISDTDYEDDDDDGSDPECSNTT